MRLVLVNGLPPATSADLYEAIAADLRRRGVDVVVSHDPAHVPGRDAAGRTTLFANCVLPPESVAGRRVYAGASLPRPSSLRLLEESGIPLMEWTLARRRHDVRALCERWRPGRLLLKRSFTLGGKGVRVVRRHAVWRLRWTPERDVFCREVNPDDGDVYKVELLAGHPLIGWVSRAPPIRLRTRRELAGGIPGAYGERELWDPPAPLAARLVALSRTLAGRGIGHVSVDFMRRPDGDLVAIELNLSRVATWWTRQFAAFRERYARALFELTAGASR